MGWWSGNRTRETDERLLTSAWVRQHRGPRRTTQKSVRAGVVSTAGCRSHIRREMRHTARTSCRAYLRVQTAEVAVLLVAFFADTGYLPGRPGVDIPSQAPIRGHRGRVQPSSPTLGGCAAPGTDGDHWCCTGARQISPGTQGGKVVCRHASADEKPREADRVGLVESVGLMAQEIRYGVLKCGQCRTSIGRSIP